MATRYSMESIRYYEKDLGEHHDREQLQTWEDRKDYLEWLEEQYEEKHRYDNISIEAAWDLV